MTDQTRERGVEHCDNTYHGCCIAWGENTKDGGWCHCNCSACVRVRGKWLLGGYSEGAHASESR